MMNCTFLSLKKLIIFLLLEAFLVIIFYCFLRKQNAKLQNNYELSSSRTYLSQSEVNMELYLWFIKYFVPLETNSQKRNNLCCKSII